MKEATGELNMTVIAVVAIAAVGAFFYAFVWPAIQNRLQANTICSTASPNYIQGTAGNDGYISCQGVQSNGTKTTYQCDYQENGRAGVVTCQFDDYTK